MPIPNRNLAESKDEFLSRCISTLVSEGKDTDQASEAPAPLPALCKAVTFAALPFR